MTPSARIAAALELAQQIETDNRPADLVAGAYFRARRYIGSSDRRAISLHLWGLLRRRARLDWWLKSKSAPATPRTRLIADLVLETKLPPREIEARFDGLGHGAAPLDPAERALIDSLARQTLDHRAMPAWVRCEFPEFLAPMLERTFGGRLEPEMAALLEPAPVDLRTNALKATRDQALAALKEAGLEARPTPLSPLGLRLPARTQLSEQAPFREGLVEVQDEGSQLAALLVGAKPGEAVCDYCAGAGGKTLALAAAMANKGRLAALDIDKRRSERAGERLRRAGAHNCTRHVLEGESDVWIKRREKSFDRVLVDAPCSGTGTWRRNPDARWRLTEDTLARLSQQQARILASAARLVKPGGWLVYVTCSLLAEENEDRVAEFRAAHPGFAVVPIAKAWAEAVGGECPATGDYLRLTPARHGTDGFFVAVLERAAAAATAGGSA